ncbi:hypothetical protein RchiOBHm_Chr5g0081861 [Rosa chinensis]|uniref:Uncharacterized protein n=1 Tax=Rosa chinensis TaxID=74649 RepID=A0A2P6QN46_ROSCH|nr:hypothetical protein RchiOBHm_Chr5g0081861 [Rosa chinensis]
MAQDTNDAELPRPLTGMTVFMEKVLNFMPILLSLQWITTMMLLVSLTATSMHDAH